VPRPLPVRGLMLEAAGQDTLDPDRLSFTHAVRVVRRKAGRPASFFPLRIADTATDCSLTSCGRGAPPRAAAAPSPEE